MSTARRHQVLKNIGLAGFWVVAIPLALGSSTGRSTSDWPQYRGPGVLGQATAAGVFERTDSVGLRVAWRQQAGTGYSGVAVAGGRVLTMFAGADSDVMVAYDEGSGKELWRHAVGSAYKGHDGSHDGPLSTPLIAGDRVVGLSAIGRLFAVKAATGEALWSKDLVGDLEAVQPYYGFATSPILVDGVLVVQVGAKDATVAGFSLETGERLWTAGTDAVQYQTPVVVRHKQKNVLVASGMQQLYGIDPRDGKILWEQAHEGGGSGYGAGGLTPLPLDDGMLFLTHKDDGSKVVRLTDDGKGLETVWENRNIRHSYGTPVYHEGHIYAFSSRFLICVDATTGEPRWRSREPGDGSLMLVDGHLVIVTKQGGLHVVRADPRGYKEIAGLAVFDDVAWAAPGFANGHIYARSMGEIARVDIGRGRTLSASTGSADAELAGTRLGNLIAELRQADDKTPSIDRFMQSVKSFPIIEGRDRVHFVYHGAADDVAVAGDLFGVSLEASMTRVPGTNLFYYSTRLEPDTRVNYVLIKDYEQILDPRNPRTTQTTAVGADMELNFSGQAMEMSWFSMPAWREPSFLAERQATQRGRLETREFESKIAGGKAGFEVYVPAGYDSNDGRYPVAYIHGGSAAKELGSWPTALDNLIGKGVQPLIAVFIGPLRLQSADYAKMFAEELVPFVDQNFRSIAEPEARANIGAGFGGNNAFFATMMQPGLVGKLATQSAWLLEFAWGPLEPLIRTQKEQPLQLYLDWGKYDLRNRHEAWDLGEANRRVSDFLRQRGYAPSGGEVHDGAGWSNWRNRTDTILETLFPQKPTG